MVEPIRPRSANATGSKARFMRDIQVAAKKQWGEDRGLLTDHLYARITHICSPDRQFPLDVDNIAKPVLDALKRIVIADDKYICQCLLTRVLVNWDGLDLNCFKNQSVLDGILENVKAEHLLVIEIGMQPEGQPHVHSGPIEVSL